MKDLVRKDYADLPEKVFEVGARVYQEHDC